MLNGKNHPEKSASVDFHLASQHPSIFTLQSPDSVAKLIRICFIRKLNFLSFRQTHYFEFIL